MDWLKIGSLCCELAEEAKTLIPSLADKISDEDLQELLNEISKHRGYDQWEQAKLCGERMRFFWAAVEFLVGVIEIAYNYWGIAWSWRTSTGKYIEVRWTNSKWSWWFYIWRLPSFVTSTISPDTATTSVLPYHDIPQHAHGARLELDEQIYTIFLHGRKSLSRVQTHKPIPIANRITIWTAPPPILHDPDAYGREMARRCLPITSTFQFLTKSSRMTLEINISWCNQWWITLRQR